MHPYADLQRAAAELQMSPTFNKLARLAQVMPINVWDREERTIALCTTTVPLLRALDAGRIAFKDDEDNAMLHALLLTALQLIFDGQFGEDMETVRAQ
jgi:hypothetical protein